ncbi:MAG TPA: sigma 54-interacting transcriptional regulator, partial [Terriglobales bacterium]|nr:sigma 54-interacting transcriptional regulator [Terriglobales bacterium]
MSASPTRNSESRSAEVPAAYKLLDANESTSIQSVNTTPGFEHAARQHDLSAAIVGANSGLRIVMEQVQMVADSDVPVLILGETGSGKEVVARAIHERSERKARPFLRVNC